MNKVKGSYLFSVTMVVTLDGSGEGGKAAVGGCMEVVIKSPTLVLPVQEPMMMNEMVMNKGATLLRDFLHHHGMGVHIAADGDE